MTIHRKATAAGIFRPSELALLGRVYDQLKAQEQSATEREALASRIIANYMSGIVDETGLLWMSSQSLGR